MSAADKHPPRFPVPDFAEHLPGPWVMRAACTPAKARVMDATTDEDRAEARVICRRCPVRADCDDWVTGLPANAPVNGIVADRDQDERAYARVVHVQSGHVQSGQVAA